MYLHHFSCALPKSPLFFNFTLFQPSNFHLSTTKKVISMFLCVRIQTGYFVLKNGGTPFILSWSQTCSEVLNTSTFSHKQQASDNYLIIIGYARSGEHFQIEFCGISNIWDSNLLDLWRQIRRPVVVWWSIGVLEWA